MRTGIRLYDTPRQPWRMCPYCGAVHDGATGNAPDVEPGAVLVCIDCGEFGLVDPGALGGWRRPTPEEARGILRDDTCVALIAAARVVRERRS